jgi:hypothetical protein
MDVYIYIIKLLNNSNLINYLTLFNLRFIMDRVKQLELIQKEALELFTKKNKDYGDAFATYGIIGVIVRIQDKIQRSISITNNGVQLVESESLRDTLLDLHNYAAMGLMVIDEA